LSLFEGRVELLLYGRVKEVVVVLGRIFELIDILSDINFSLFDYVDKLWLLSLFKDYLISDEAFDLDDTQESTEDPLAKMRELGDASEEVDLLLQELLVESFQDLLKVPPRKGSDVGAPKTQTPVGSLVRFRLHLQGLCA